MIVEPQILGQPRPGGACKFVIDFEGGPFVELAKQDPVEAVVTTWRGRINNVYACRRRHPRLACVLRSLRRRP
jgi:glucan biosynthesis protein